MSHPLEGAYVKIRRAQKHIDEFVAWMQPAIDANMQGFRVDSDPNTGDNLFKFLAMNQVPSDVMGAVGDALHNLRSALDHVACAIAWNYNPKVNIEQVYFPIVGSEQTFLNAVKNGNIAHFGPDGVKFISLFEPYNGGHGAKGDLLLWAIHRLDITDKHRTLLTSIPKVHGGLSTKPLNLGPGAGPWQSLEKDVVIAQWPAGDPHPQVQYAFMVAFAEPDVAGDEPIAVVLTNMRNVVANLVERASKEIAW